MRHGESRAHEVECVPHESFREVGTLSALLVDETLQTSAVAMVEEERAVVGRYRQDSSRPFRPRHRLPLLHNFGAVTALPKSDDDQVFVVI